VCMCHTGILKMCVCVSHWDLENVCVSHWNLENVCVSHWDLENVCVCHTGILKMSMDGKCIELARTRYHLYFIYAAPPTLCHTPIQAILCATHP